jgi:hypothetical protein
MSQKERDEELEERIINEIVVDAYGAEEQSISWYYYLEEMLEYPFGARCLVRRAISPLKIGDNIDVIDLGPMEECEHEMFVMMRWDRDGLAVPLSQLEFVDGRENTKQAVRDWQYWVQRGYRFG